MVRGWGRWWYLDTTEDDLFEYIIKVTVCCLQPENVLLDDNMNVKLSDFGFASVISHDKELEGDDYAYSSFI